ncbi:deah box polypeptide 36 [Moniliophthora roreri MCA 2997]|uniref:Deah box polypeptide 36 n=1 Tax=Moniliophthora roreri (strain MCA 2997) TaxID=1381753 RepID=V2X2J6_MONRO|nr:deah box polypeptide 36 [Moniliophthora roreri MCA 2997]
MQFDPTFAANSLKRRSPSDQTAEYSTASAKYARAESSRRPMPQPSRGAPPSRGTPSAFGLKSSGSSKRPAPTHSTVPAFGSAKASSSFGLAKGNSTSKGKGKALNRLPPQKVLAGPLRDKEYVEQTYGGPGVQEELKKSFLQDPKSGCNNIALKLHEKPVEYTTEKGIVALDGGQPLKVQRVRATFPSDPPIIGEGDSESPKEAPKLAALSLLYQLQRAGLVNAKRETITSLPLSDGSEVDLDKAKRFMDFYCNRYRFSQPQITYQENKGTWEAVMTVQGRKIGMGSGATKKDASQQCHLDVVQYLEQCDPELWKEFVKRGDLTPAQRLYFHVSYGVNNAIRNLVVDLKGSSLWKNRPSLVSSAPATSVIQTFTRSYVPPHSNYLARKSKMLLERRQKYLSDPAMEKMRATRATLPVYGRADTVLDMIEKNDVTILMAATGSGKTTQVPQIILDSFIGRGEGARCNILCTQPRRLAALSVADRVAKERNERLGQSIGYQVRFEAKPPEDNGSVTFMTTGMFLKKMQSGLEQTSNVLENVTHVVVDEVHERDVDTDLLLVVLKRWLADRKQKGKPIKVVLMSATIDPTLFQTYFSDNQGQPAKVIEVPGRAFPVERHFLEDFMPKIADSSAKWVFNDDSVAKYVIKQLGQSALPAGTRLSIDPSKISTDPDEDNDLPYPLIAATIAHVLQKSDSGHVLTFLAGWDDITAVQKLLLNPPGPLGIPFHDTSKYHIHLLHSTIPLAEQQVIFEPPPEGVRRIILSTNIAETSVTIPDVVYVVDTGRLKEQRYDPQKHMSSLVSAWVGSSNLNQRAGRAGRHRPGEYFGVISKEYAAQLQPYQTVEIKRVDLSNVVMHVKALNFSGMTVEEVLAQAIEPPPEERVTAAIKDLQMYGALDEQKGLTSLGRVLLQIPVEVQVGKLLLYGSFFRCLDQALTLAAILTNRDPWCSPMHLKQESRDRKMSFCPPGIRSDPLTTLEAYNQWYKLQSTGQYITANRFCVDNFLSKPTLLMIEKLKGHLLKSLHQSGVIQISGGGKLEAADKYRIPPELNENGDSLPLLCALIASGQQPKFAVQISDRLLATRLDKHTFMHPSSVNHPKNFNPKMNNDDTAKRLYAFTEKRRNISTSGSGPPNTFLVDTTRLQPLTYLLFGAFDIREHDTGLLCDEWINIIGNLDAIDDVWELRKLVDGCMLRVFEGLIMSKRHHRAQLPVYTREEEEPESGDDFDDSKDLSLSPLEVKELDLLSRDLVNILDTYGQDRLQSSRNSSRPGTPGTPATPMSLFGQGMPMLSGHSTPYGRSQFNSRASTPVGRMSHRFN